ncbi:hypothetical protein [Aneurinibacillus aneurinilyticus]|jgi:hypothetical protein|uniref:hypothetical protein n=1 Tax=Aneurinibacillus aneurinilyticus TaxID=1391 RepID=UPI0023F7047C|nr:hypothetical protein [Aneurinibacillus aneurinilyticus]MCI1694298.1 hypothetical protein [Aneurinibacillus aneurinilyticus]
MGKYVSIRGWIECEDGDLLKIKEVYDYFLDNYSENEISSEKRKLYQTGWGFPSNVVNWTAYVFYGADIREYHTDFIKAQLTAIAKINQDITGFFLIDDHDGENKFCWQLLNGSLIETEQGIVIFNG